MLNTYGSTSFSVGFYLSTNDYISTSDLSLGTSRIMVAAGHTSTTTFTRSLTIPLTVAAGTYYLGFLIDPDKSMSEANETNNIQPMPRKITIY